MAIQIALLLVLLMVEGVLAMLNPGLLAQRGTVALWGYTFDGPIVVLAAMAVNITWVLLLLIAALTEWSWARRARVLSERLAAREEEIYRLKAAAFERPVAPPPHREIVTTGPAAATG